MLGLQPCIFALVMYCEGSEGQMLKRAGQISRPIQARASLIFFFFVRFCVGSQRSGPESLLTHCAETFSLLPMLK